MSAVENERPEEEYRRLIRTFLSAGPATRSPKLVALAAQARGDLALRGITPRISEEAEFLKALEDDGVSVPISPENVRQLLISFEAFCQLSVDNGGDVSLIPDEEERAIALERGFQLLSARHDVEALLRGFLEWVNIRAPLSNRVDPGVASVRSSLAELDGRAAELVSHFVPLNPKRRELASEFPAREVWWWHARSACDLEKAYEASETDRPLEGHLAECEHCRSVALKVRHARVIVKSLGEIEFEHPPTDSIVALYEGELGKEEEAATEGHLRLCEGCRAEFESIRDDSEVPSWTAADVEAPARAVSGPPSRAGEWKPVVLVLKTRREPSPSSSVPPARRRGILGRAAGAVGVSAVTFSTRWGPRSARVLRSMLGWFSSSIHRGKQDEEEREILLQDKDLIVAMERRQATLIVQAKWDQDAPAAHVIVADFDSGATLAEGASSAQTSIVDLGPVDALLRRSLRITVVRDDTEFVLPRVDVV